MDGYISYIKLFIIQVQFIKENFNNFNIPFIFIFQLFAFKYQTYNLLIFRIYFSLMKSSKNQGLRKKKLPIRYALGTG